MNVKRDYGNLYPNVSCRQALQLTIHTQPAIFTNLLLTSSPWAIPTKFNHPALIY